MPGLRDHEPIVIEEFNGLWKRGDADSCPIDHFSDCNNIAFFESGFETRPGINTFLAMGDVVRMYNYKMQDGESLLILNSQGQIYHALLDGSNTTYGPILTIADMQDFAFIAHAGRAYISPFKTYTDNNGVNYQKGLENEYVYVYKGDGTAARKAAGFPPSNSEDASLKAFNSSFDGLVTKGVHLVTVVTQADAFLVDVFPVVYAPGAKEIELVDIPLGPGGTTSRKILMTRAIDPKNYVPDQSTYTYYLAATIADNTTTDLRISVADTSLVTTVGYGTIPTYAGMKAKTDTAKGYADLGFHLFACVYETDTGYLTALGPENFASLEVIDIQKGIKIQNIPVSPDSFVTKRHLVATRRIVGYNGDQTGYQFYFIPDGNIDNNTDTEKVVSFYDADLFDDASHLIDNFSEIPAGVCLNEYNGRSVIACTFDDESIVYLSAPGEPEAVDQVDGIVIAPLDGNPVTYAQPLRDVLYIFKKSRTFATVDNNDYPSSWTVAVVDQGIGAPVHGVIKVLDSEGVNIDFLMVIDFSGLMQFNGTYARPELSYKIQDLWLTYDKNLYHKFQGANESLNQIVYIVLPDGNMLIADYGSGLDAKNIAWCPWTFDLAMTTVAIYNVNTVLLASQEIYSA